MASTPAGRSTSYRHSHRRRFGLASRLDCSTACLRPRDGGPGGGIGQGVRGWGALSPGTRRVCRTKYPKCCLQETRAKRSCASVGVLVGLQHHRADLRCGRADRSGVGPIKAVQTGRVYLSPSLPFEGGFPAVGERPGRAVVARQGPLSGQFPEDLKPITRDFYQRFYHMTPTDTQNESVLAGRGLTFPAR
jgi:hypothetical protein